MWKQCEHWPHTRGQSSPGTLPVEGRERWSGDGGTGASPLQPPASDKTPQTRPPPRAWACVQIHCTLPPALWHPCTHQRHTRWVGDDSSHVESEDWAGTWVLQVSFPRWQAPTYREVHWGHTFTVQPVSSSKCTGCYLPPHMLLALHPTRLEMLPLWRAPGTDGKLPHCPGSRATSVPPISPTFCGKPIKWLVWAEHRGCAPSPTSGSPPMLGSCNLPPPPSPEHPGEALCT